MKCKKILFCASMLIASQNLYAFLQPQKEIFVCNSETGTPNCSRVDDSYLKQVTEIKYGHLANSEDCNLGDPISNCEAVNQLVSVDFLVVNAETGEAQKTRVKMTYLNGVNTFDVLSVDNQQIDLQITQEIVLFENDYRDMKRKFSFKENSQGRFFNYFGQSPDMVGITVESQGQEFGNCKTAISFPYDEQAERSLPTCKSFLSGQFQAIHDRRGFGTRFMQEIADAIPSYSNYGADFNITKVNNFSITIHYKDGSKLVLDFVSDSGNLKIFFDKDASLVSDNKSINEFEKDALKPNGSIGSRNEASSLAYLGGMETCYSRIQQEGYYQQFLIKVIERDENGYPLKVTFELISQTGISSETIHCTRNGINGS